MTVELRAPTLDDLAEIAELANRASDELFGEREETETTVRMWLTTPDLELDKDFRIAAQDGRITGYADLGAHPVPRFWLDLRVPMSADDEIRAALIIWGEERAREREGELIRGFTSELDLPGKAALERRGYKLIRHSYRMRIDFEEELPEPEWPERITVRPVTEDDAEAVYDAHQESFRDSWEPGDDSFEEWKHWMLEEGVDLTLWFLAHENGEIAGVALCKPHDAEEGLGLGAGPRRAAPISPARARPGPAPTRLPRVPSPRLPRSRARCRCREHDRRRPPVRERRHARLPPLGYLREEPPIGSF